MDLNRAIELFDLESYLRQNFDPLKVSGDEYQVNCFAPKGCGGSDTKQHLWVNVEKKAWICYKCGYGDHSQQPGTGNLVRFIADNEKISTREVMKRLGSTVETTPDEDLEELLEKAFEDEITEKEIEDREIKLPSTFKRVKSLSYLDKRGFPSSLYGWYDVRFCSSYGAKQWHRRCIFPIYDAAGRCVSAVGRAVDDRRQPRWYNWPQSDLQRLLWPLGAFTNGSWVPRMPQPRIMLTEGIFDALGASLHLGAYAGALCTFGHKLSERQVDVLGSLQPVEVILAWDFGARDKMVRFVDRLRGRFERVSVFPFRDPCWKGADFGDMLTRKDLPAVFQREMQETISVDSAEYLQWEVEARLP